MFYICIIFTAVCVLSALTTDPLTALSVFTLALGFEYLGCSLLLLVFDIKNKVWRGQGCNSFLRTYLSSMSFLVFILGVGFNQLPSSSGSPLSIHLYLLAPNILVFFYCSMYDMCKSNKTYEGEALVSLMRFIFNLAFNALLLDISLKLDGSINWTWSQVFFPYWILFSVLVTVILVTLGIFVTILCPLIVCKSKDWKKTISSVWINMNLGGILVFMALLEIELIKVVDNHNINLTTTTFRPMVMRIIYMVIYVILTFILTLVFSKSIR